MTPCIAKFLLAWMTLAGFGTTCALAADAPATQPASASQPAADDADALIRQFQSDDFQVREAAFQKLHDMGKAALPALQRGADSKDPETKTRCQVLIKQLADEAVTVPDNSSSSDFVSNGSLQVHLEVGKVGNRLVKASVSVVDVAAKNVVHAYILNFDKSGLVITEQINQTFKTYKAKNVDELKTKEPEGYKIYDKYFASLNLFQ